MEEKSRASGRGSAFDLMKHVSDSAVQAIKTRFWSKGFINHQEKWAGQRQLSVWTSGGQFLIPTFQTLSSSHNASMESRWEWIFPAVLWRLVYLWKNFNKKKIYGRSSWLVVGYPRNRGVTVFSFLIREKLLDGEEIVTKKYFLYP